MVANLQDMLLLVRTRMQDLRVRLLPEHDIVDYLNEGKDDLAGIIRQARENFFEETVSRTISSTTTPNYSSITLPDNFSELRELRVTQSGYEDTNFSKLSKSDQRFRQALIDGGNMASGQGMFYYDFSGEFTLIFAPGSDMDLAVDVTYIKTIPDMTLPSDYPTGIPRQYARYMVRYAETECLREVNDARLSDWESRLERMEARITDSVNARQIRDAQYVVGFMEEEFW